MSVSSQSIEVSDNVAAEIAKLGDRKIATALIGDILALCSKSPTKQPEVK